MFIKGKRLDIYWGPKRMRILIAANPFKSKKFESAIFWGLDIKHQLKYP
ncbi:MAG: hypothetical protein LBS83_02815 [Holosporales bacterium]|nr:hypothetical protein [Holosporales bacterium]